MKNCKRNVICLLWKVFNIAGFCEKKPRTLSLQCLTVQAYSCKRAYQTIFPVNIFLSTLKKICLQQITVTKHPCLRKMILIFFAKKLFQSGSGCHLWKSSPVWAWWITRNWLYAQLRYKIVMLIRVNWQGYVHFFFVGWLLSYCILSSL